jgi:hypothetical protein
MVIWGACGRVVGGMIRLRQGYGATSPAAVVFFDIRAIKEILQPCGCGKAFFCLQASFRLSHRPLRGCSFVEGR